MRHQLRGYFEYLIRNYANCLPKYGIDPTAIKWKKEYQDEGLGLQKRNFKPEPDVWEKFRHISFSYGLSMCKMFVVLMELDHQRWMEAGCPDEFYELPQQRIYTPDFGMNSHQKISIDTKKVILDALSSNRYTVMIRNMDFTRQKLNGSPKYQPIAIYSALKEPYREPLPEKYCKIKTIIKSSLHRICMIS